MSLWRAGGLFAASNIDGDGLYSPRSSQKTGVRGSSHDDSVTPPSDPPLDRAGVIEAVNRIAGAVDAGEWALVGNMLAPEVEIDLSAIDGAGPVTTQPKDLIGRLQKTLSGLDATQHLLTNHVVDRVADPPARGAYDGRVCEAHLYAKYYLLNYRGGDSWTFGGHCWFGFLYISGGWRIRRLSLVMLWGEGNERILDLARSRYSAGLAESVPPGPPGKEAKFG